MKRWPDNRCNKHDEALATWQREHPEARGLLPISVGMEEALAQWAAPPHQGDRWGRWTYWQNRTLNHDGGYQVDLDRCKSAAAVLDWIAQVSAKTWCTREDAGALVEALDACLDLQGTLCGGRM